MAAGKFNMQKASGGVASITIADGVSNTDLVLPESGNVATTTYVDGKMVRGTAVTASGTSIDFTEIPSWAKRITVMFNGVSTNGSSIVQVQIGDSDGVETSGYAGCVGQSGSAAYNFISGFATGIDGSSGYVRNGKVEINNINNNTYVADVLIGYSDSARFMAGAGSKTLSSTLDRVRITTANGTDTFDAGTINILYEG